MMMITIMYTFFISMTHNTLPTLLHWCFLWHFFSPEDKKQVYLLCTYYYCLCRLILLTSIALMLVFTLLPSVLGKLDGKRGCRVYSHHFGSGFCRVPTATSVTSDTYNKRQNIRSNLVCKNRIGGRGLRSIQRTE